MMVVNRLQVHQWYGARAFSSFRVQRCQDANALGLGVWKRLEQDGVGNAEGRRIRADSQCQRHDRDRRERRGLAEPAKREAQIVKHCANSIAVSEDDRSRILVFADELDAQADALERHLRPAVPSQTGKQTQVQVQQQAATNPDKHE